MVTHLVQLAQFLFGQVLHGLVQGALIEAGERLRTEALFMATGQGQVQLGGSLTQQPGHLHSHAGHELLVLLWQFSAAGPYQFVRSLRRACSCRGTGQSPLKGLCRKIEEQLPGVALVGNILLHQAEDDRLAAFVAVLQ